MLITSDTMPPLLDGNGNPVRAGKLHVLKGPTQDSEPSPLFLDLDFKQRAANPIQLDSTGRMPNALYTDGNEAWCFLYSFEGILLRSYPLQITPEARGFTLPQDLTVRTLSVLPGGTLRANKITLSGRSEIIGGRVRADELSAEAAYVRTLDIEESLQIAGGEKFGSSVIISPANVSPDTVSAGNWFTEVFLVGSYGVYLHNPTHDGLFDDALEINSIVPVNVLMDYNGAPDVFNSGRTIVAVGFLNAQLPGRRTYKVRICGRAGTLNDLQTYIVCRVE